MNAILALIDMLLETELSEEQRTHLTVVSHSATALLMLLNDILDLSKIEAGKLELDPTSFNPHEWLSELMQPFVIRAAAKALDFTWQVINKTFSFCKVNIQIPTEVCTNYRPCG